MKTGKSLTLAALACVALSHPLQAGPRGFAYNADGQLFSFDLARPSDPVTIGTAAGAGVKGVDRRPGTDLLYAIDVNATTSQLYSVNLTTGIRTPVGTGFANAGTVGVNPYALSSTDSIGFDFNPTTLQVDGSIRIRMVSSAGTDLRLNSDTGLIAAVDGALQYSGGSPAVVAVSGGAYLFTDGARVPGTAPATQLFYLETANDNLVTFAGTDPNAGIFTTVGALGVDIGTAASFDIFTGNNLNKAYAVLNVAGETTTTLRMINLTTGAAQPSLGSFAAGFEPVGGFAVAEVADPVPVNTFGYAYNAAGQLFRFNVTNPAGARAIGAPVGTAMKGLDFRPGTSALYAIEVGATTSQLYTVALATGVRTAVGAPFPNSGTVSAVNYTLDPAAFYGFDFNPTTLQVDGSIRIRLVNSAGADLRLNSDTGQIAAVDGTLAYATGTPATSAISGAAYTNSDSARLPGAGAGALLYYIDPLNDNLVNLPANPNGGLFQLVGPLGVDVGGSAAFDILYDRNANAGYVAVADAGGLYTLRRVNLVTGAAGASLGSFPTGFEPVGGMAIAVIAPSPVIDAAAPGVRILRPNRRRDVTTSRSYLVRGSASDDRGVARVELKLRNQSYRKTTGTTRWRQSVRLIAGDNRIQVRAIDTAGKRSVVRERIVRRDAR